MLPRLAPAALAVAALAALATTLGCDRAAAQEPQWRFALEARERLQSVNNPEFDGEAPADDWVWSQRIAASAEGPLTPWLSARVNVQSAVVSGPETSPVDSNVLDAREAYLQFGDETRWLRVGRQELLLGSQRLVGTRDGTNVRRGWDGVRAGWRGEAWSLDALAVALVEVEPEGVFNDHADEDRLLAGLYATGPAALGEVDLYLLYAETDARATVEGVADQQRYSAGVRSFGEHGAVFWNWEAIYQWGRQGALDISAWTLAANTGYRFDAAWSPEVMVSANIASGDERGGDGELGTFDALYPRGNYFSDAAILGPANFYNFNPYLTLTPSERLTLNMDVNWFWRLEDADGVYGPPGNLLRAPAGEAGDFVATGLSLSALYEITERVSAEAIFSRVTPGEVIEETGPSQTVDFIELTLRIAL